MCTALVRARSGVWCCRGECKVSPCGRIWGRLHYACVELSCSTIASCRSCPVRQRSITLPWQLMQWVRCALASTCEYAEIVQRTHCNALHYTTMALRFEPSAAEVFGSIKMIAVSSQPLRCVGTLLLFFKTRRMCHEYCRCNRCSLRSRQIYRSRLVAEPNRRCVTPAWGSSSTATIKQLERKLSNGNGKTEWQHK